MLLLRCSASPDIDYSKFGFVIVLQLLAGLSIVVTGHIFPASLANFKLSSFAVVVFAVEIGTIAMARDAVLFGTAIDPHRDQKPLDYGCNNPELRPIRHIFAPKLILFLCQHAFNSG